MFEGILQAASLGMHYAESISCCMPVVNWLTECVCILELAVASFVTIYIPALVAKSPHIDITPMTS